MRRLAAAVVIAASLAVAVPAVAAADPDLGSSGSSDEGGIAGILQAGIAVLQAGSSAGSSAPVQTQPCNASTKSGGAGVTETLHELGRTGPTAFVLSYETYNIPDQIQVFYSGALVYDSGYVGDNINEGTGSATIGLPAGGATAVLVRVTGPSGTDWDYTVHCPGA